MDGYDFYSQVLNSPKYIVAPMVDQSELSWRILSRRYGAQLCYTPMLNAKIFIDEGNKKYKTDNFTTNEQDRPLIVQICGNDPEIILKAAKMVEDKCDAIDLNLGCPQIIAKRGHYGAYLQDEWNLISKIVKTLHDNLSIPVTCKIRIFPDLQKSIEYAKMLEASGCQILTVHGRVREQKGHKTGLANWEYIKAIKEAVSVPVFANGNIAYFEDIEECIKQTGADGVMTAEGNLYNPGIFVPNKFFFVCDLVDEYLEICKTCPTPVGFIKGHLFKMFRHCLNHHTDLRDKMARTNNLEDFIAISKEFRERLEEIKKLEPDSEYANGEKYKKLPNGQRQFPYWICHPFFRPLDDSNGTKKRSCEDTEDSDLKKHQSC